MRSASAFLNAVPLVGCAENLDTSITSWDSSFFLIHPYMVESTTGLYGLTEFTNYLLFKVVVSPKREGLLKDEVVLKILHSLS